MAHSGGREPFVQHFRKKRFETVSAFRQAVVAIVQRYSVEDLIWFRLTQHNIPRPVRAYRGQPARVDHDRHATVEVRVDEAAFEATIRRFGWRIYGTNQPVASLSLAQAVLAYRSEYQVERSFGRLKGRPLSLTPKYVQRMTMPRDSFACCPSPCGC